MYLMVVGCLETKVNFGDGFRLNFILNFVF